MQHASLRNSPTFSSGDEREVGQLRLFSPPVEDTPTASGSHGATGMECVGERPANGEPEPELLAELRVVSERLETASPEAILRWAVERFRPRFTMATAFGPEGMTMIHMLAEIAPETPIFNLDTGYQFPETLELRDRVASGTGSRSS